VKYIDSVVAGKLDFISLTDRIWAGAKW
jgi:hypothetical protein